MHGMTDFGTMVCVVNGLPAHTKEMEKVDKALTVNNGASSRAVLPAKAGLLERTSET